MDRGHCLLHCWRNPDREDSGEVLAITPRARRMLPGLGREGGQRECQRRETAIYGGVRVEAMALPEIMEGRFMAIHRCSHSWVDRALAVASAMQPVLALAVVLAVARC